MRIFNERERNSSKIISVNCRKFEQVLEERIEVNCSEEKLKDVIKAIKEVHPYDEVAFDVYPLLN